MWVKKVRKRHNFSCGFRRVSWLSIWIPESHRTREGTLRERSGNAQGTEIEAQLRPNRTPSDQTTTKNTPKRSNEIIADTLDIPLTPVHGRRHHEPLKPRDMRGNCQKCPNHPFGTCFDHHASETGRIWLEKVRKRHNFSRRFRHVSRLSI